MIRSPAGFDGGDRIKRYLDYYQPSYGVMMLSAGQAFTPASLFAAGEQGVWYDPSDLTTMFQDAAGTTPVTAVEQPVGLLLDKSKGLALGAELVTNGDFSSGTGWTVGSGWAISGGTLNYSGGFNVSYFTAAANAFVAGRYYKVTLTVSGNTSGNVNAYLNVPNNGALNPVNISGDGEKNFLLLAGVTCNGFHFVGNSATGAMSIDNISVRELSGNHASQSTAASRPVLSARVNQLLATATLSTQSVTTLATTYTLAFSGAGTVTATGTNIGVYSAGSNSLVCTAGTLTLTVVGSVTLADLRVTNVGVGLPAYQAVVTSTNYDTSGFPLFLRFDGTDDSLATGTIDFTATDKMSVFAGVRELPPGAGVLAELSASINANTSAFLLLFQDGSTSIDSFYSRGSGSLVGARWTSAPTTPTTQIYTGLSNIAAPSVVLRENGTQVASSTSSQGTGNYGNYPLYIGRRGGSTLPYNGNLYSLIVRGAQSTAAQIASTETWVNGKTMAY